MKKGLIYALLLSVCILPGTFVSAQEDQSFEEYKKQEKKRYQQYIEDEAKAYEQYMKEEQEGIENLRKEIEEFWGTGEFISSTKKDWVEYSKDKKSRSDVDFENGVATVEVLVTPEEAKDPEIAKKKVEEAVKKLVTTKGTTKDYETSMEKPEPLEKTAVLKGQLKTSKGKTVTAENADDFAREVISKRNIKKEIVKGTDGKERAKLTISLSLAPDYIKVRASKYEKEINRYADHYKLPPELVYAVIHTESYFNPKAKSPAPAYGLMQLVPTSGARDAYRYVYKKDKIVTANYLYRAEKNIELGSAYLQLLMSRDFKKVSDINSRMLCAIAAYNTGAGNVARAFTGSTSISKAVPKINRMSYEELYRYLREHLPHGETRDYIRKVSSRIGMYHEWKNGSEE